MRRPLAAELTCAPTDLAQPLGSQASDYCYTVQSVASGSVRRGDQTENRIMPNLPNDKQSRLTSRIQKGGALLGDMRQLVCNWGSKPTDTSPHVFARSVLSKATYARAKDTYIRAFLPRMIEGSPEEAWKLCASLELKSPSPEIVASFYYWITARAEWGLYQFVTGELYAASRSGMSVVTPADLSMWIRKTCAEEGVSWSDAVTIKVARGMLATLRDFGVLSGTSKKTISPSHLPLEAFCLIAWCLRMELNDPRELKSHPDWRLFLLSPAHVERLLLEVHQHGWLHYQAAGEVTRIEFPSQTFDEYTRHVLA